MAGDVDPEAIVIRFRPTNPNSVLQQAEKEHRRIGHYRLSVFASPAADGENAGDVLKRLVVAAELDGVHLANNVYLYVCSSAAELHAAGFTFHKDPDEANEPPEHYSVDLGAKPEVEDVVKFLSCFVPEKMPK